MTWWKLENRFNKKTRAKRLSDIHGVVNPDVANNTHSVLPYIERWEERIQGLDEKDRPNEDMKMALIAKICLKKLQ